MLSKIKLPREALANDAGTSDGTQIKYYYQGKWYKIDRYGGEGEAEELASNLLMCSNLPRDQYVIYRQVEIDGMPGCVSDHFLKEGEEYLTLYRLYANLHGKDLAQQMETMDYDDRFEFLLEFTDRELKLDLREYLANMLTLDAFILNEDRHFNNMGVLFDGKSFKTAPIFDNGKSLFVGNRKFDERKPFSENRKYAFAKAFGTSFSLNMEYLKTYATIQFDPEKIRKMLEEHPEYSSRARMVVLNQLELI